MNQLKFLKFTNFHLFTFKLQKYTFKLFEIFKAAPDLINIEIHLIHQYLINVFMHVSFSLLYLLFSFTSYFIIFKILLKKLILSISLINKFFFVYLVIFNYSAKIFVIFSVIFKVLFSYYSS